MNFLQIASDLIPGYGHLTQEEQQSFESSDIGQRFVTVINEVIEIFNATEKKEDESNSSYFSAIYSIIHYYLSSEREVKQAALIEEYNTIKNDLINEIKDSNEYKEVVACTIAHCLRKWCPRFFTFNS